MNGVDPRPAMPVVLQANTIFATFRSFTPGQLEFLRGKGIRILASCAGHPEAQAFFDRQGAEYCPVPMQRDISPLADVRAFFRVLALLRKVRPHLVQGSTPKAAFLFLVAAWLLRIPARLFFMRGVRSSGLTGMKRVIVRLMERTTCATAHRVLCTSASVREEIVREGLCPAHKASVLANGSGNGIDTDRFSRASVLPAEREALLAGLGIPADTFIILFVGRIVRDKGVVELAAAWDALKRKYRDCVLVMVGNTEAGDPVPEQVLTTLKGDERVKMVGVKPDVRAYLAVADVFVLPTYREGIPIALLEASAMSLPVVATRVTGCLDAVVEDVTGVFVPPRDPAALEAAISRYVDDAELRRCHGEAGRTMVVERFDRKLVWDALARQYESLLDFAAEKDGRLRALRQEAS